MHSAPGTTTTPFLGSVLPWAAEKILAFGQIDCLECLSPMTWYYRRVRASIRHLCGDPGFAASGHLARMTFEQIRRIRRYIDTDLHNYSIEFYLQRKEWARSAALAPRSGKDQKRGGPHPSVCVESMKEGAGFFRVRTLGEQAYTYEQFLGETLPFFIAIHVHLVSINRALSDLHYYVTELPFATFTDIGKSEIRHLTTELDRIMTGLLVATHLQPRSSWQSDLVSYLISCRADCQRLFQTIPRYYQSHRLRLIIFPIDPLNEVSSGPHALPIACSPWSAGVYLDFLIAYQNIAQHVMAVLHWALRLYSLWYFVPRRVLRVISPVFRE